MPRFTTAHVVLLVSCASFLPLLVSAKDYPTPRFDLSNYTLDFFALALGFFDNLKQTQSGNSDVLRVTLKQISVDVPALRPAPVYYTERVVGGKIQNMRLGAVYERPGPSIEVQLYSFTDPSVYKPGEFNVSTLYNLKKEDLRRDENCTGIYKRLARAVYVGTLPDSTNCIGRNNPNFGDTYVCSGASLVFPPTLLGYSKTPSIFDRIGDRFPTVGFPDTYDRICGRPGQVTRRY